MKDNYCIECGALINPKDDSITLTRDQLKTSIKFHTTCFLKVAGADYCPSPDITPKKLAEIRELFHVDQKKKTALGYTPRPKKSDELIDALTHGLTIYDRLMNKSK